MDSCRRNHDSIAPCPARCSRQAVWLLLLLQAGTPSARGENGAPTRIAFTDKLPYGTESVDYFATIVDDPVARLQASLQGGSAQLDSDPQHGYLKSVLNALQIPVESQLLVFSRTARSPDLVSPHTPRAIFFNDTVSVAWIHSARELELTSVDPRRGVNFYTLLQPDEESQDKTPPAFVRRDRCLACHSGQSSLEVPGLLLRAFQTDRSGKMLFGYSRVTHDMAYDRRWGGWYVTGSPERLVHRGNLVGQSENDRHKEQPGFLSSLEDLAGRGDFAGWPAATSDFVAHLIFSHQVHGTNLLIRVGMEARLNRHSDAQDRLIRYLVFADEPKLNLSESDAIACRSRPYARWFQKHGLGEDCVESLRELDLTGSLFKNRLSFLINTPLFDGLPPATRDRLLVRIWHGLTDENPEEAFRHLGTDERIRIVRIVQATNPNLPAIWKSGTR